MRSLSRSVIALSMMVVVSAVARNSARAQDTGIGAAAPATASVPVEAVSAPEAGPAASEKEATPRHKRRATPVVAPPAENREPHASFGGPAQMDHKLQTGLSIMPGTGYRLIVPYKEFQYCGDSSGQTGKRVCAHSVPVFLDFQLSFGVASRADLIVDLRFGLQADPALPGPKSHQFAVAPGLRFWLDQEVALKFFTTLQFVYDYTDFAAVQTGISSSDVGVRNANGLMYDPIRNVGFFIQFGETIGFMRWFRIDLDVGLGAQIRFP
jgi:hypothetical protein